MTLEQILDRFDGVERSLVVVNRTAPDPVLNMLVDTFGDDAVTVIDGRAVGETADSASTERGSLRQADGGETGTREGTIPSEAARSRGVTAGEFTAEQSTGSDPDATRELVIDAEALRQNDAVSFDGDSLSDVENLALLIEGGAVVAGSTLDELGEAVLFVNSDLYITGSRSVDELDLPSVISGLDDAMFTLRGYPESNRQKLLLITISRFIERIAWIAGDGMLRSSFQRLSRLDDEVGTREVYERVSAAGVDTHLYGVPDDVPNDLDATIHSGYTSDFTDSWFVVYRPSDGTQPVGPDVSTDIERGLEGGVALLAVESEPRVWSGIWTFEPDRIAAIHQYIKRTL
ncbi:hypothetical protein [Halorubrum laminariae]|uniref:Histidine kinase n=1 Tax=Halorubrum laminariae TaxID=1433523 RepID=A0ABD6C3E1_9EURY|nr:hypothetical protein [Halorubrum laminariae]